MTYFVGPLVLLFDRLQFKAMYDIEAAVTTANKDQLELTGDGPIDWLQVAGSTKIQRKLGQAEVFAGPVSSGGIVATERREIPSNRGFHPHLKTGDR
jgi:hypothetical protein